MARLPVTAPPLLKSTRSSGPGSTGGSGGAGWGDQLSGFYVGYNLPRNELAIVKHGYWNATEAIGFPGEVGKVIENDEHHMIVVDAGLPIVVSLLEHKPTQTREVKLNSWVTFWPVPPTHGIILGRAS